MLSLVIAARPAGTSSAMSAALVSFWLVDAPDNVLTLGIKGFDHQR